jgi:hypothetical protein
MDMGGGQYNESPFMTRGIYVGDGTQNRAIAHGLGKIPRLIIIHNAFVDHLWWMTTANGSYVFNDAAAISTNVTAWNNINFFVGGDATGLYTNGNLNNFIWYAFA